MDAENQGTEWDVFPTGLYRSEWSEMMKPDLDGMAEAIDRDRAMRAMRAARARCRAKFAKPEQATAAPVPIPVLGCPSGRLLGEAPQEQQHHAAQLESPHGFGPLRMPRVETTSPRLETDPPHTLQSLPA